VTRRISFTPPAQSQFLSALTYNRADRPSAARAFRNRAAKALSGLLDFPESGRVHWPAWSHEVVGLLALAAAIAPLAWLAARRPS
jgi:plasmid stabilization system protein ParE